MFPKVFQKIENQMTVIENQRKKFVEIGNKADAALDDFYEDFDTKSLDPKVKKLIDTLSKSLVKFEDFGKKVLDSEEKRLLAIREKLSEIAQRQK